MLLLFLQFLLNVVVAVVGTAVLEEEEEEVVEGENKVKKCTEYYTVTKLLFHHKESDPLNV